MSWPAPDYEGEWEYEGNRCDEKYISWSGKHKYIYRYMWGNGKVYQYVVNLDEAMSYKNYNDAEAAAYFYLMYGLTRTRGQGENY